MRGNQGRYALLGFLIGIGIILLVFLLDVIFLDLPLSWTSIVAHFQSEPAHWVVSASPIILAAVLWQMGKHQDQVDQLSADLQERIKQATAEISSDKQFFETLLQSNPLAIVILDEEERIISINPAFEELFGYLHDEVLGQKLDPLITDQTLQGEAVGFTQAVLEGGSIQESAVRRRKDGSEIPVDFYAVQVLFEGSKIGALGIYEDVSKRVAYEKKLTQLLEETDKLARTDALTGLHNRRAILEMADTEISRAQREGQPMALALLDIDGFKEINDELGHKSGDDALQKLADLLKSNKRGYDGLGRWGGDEFMIVLPNTDLGTAQKIGTRLCKLVEGTQFQFSNGKSTELTISVGVAAVEAAQAAEADAASLFNNADKALYSAKARGRNQSAASEEFSGQD